MAIRQRFSIICDEVRREDNGKLIILGMYAGVITVPQFPAILPSLTILSVFDGDRQESLPFEMRVTRLETGQVIVGAQGFLAVPQPGMGVLPIRFTPMPFQEAGSYNAVLQVNAEREPAAVVDFQVMLPNQVQQQSRPPFQRG